METVFLANLREKIERHPYESYKAIASFCGLVPRELISVQATRELREKVRDPDIMTGARALGLTTTSLADTELQALQLATVVVSLLCLGHGRANTGRPSEVSSFIKEECGFERLSIPQISPETVRCLQTINKYG